VKGAMHDGSRMGGCRAAAAIWPTAASAVPLRAAALVWWEYSTQLDHVLSRALRNKSGTWAPVMLCRSPKRTLCCREATSKPLNDAPVTASLACKTSLDQINGDEAARQHSVSSAAWRHSAVEAGCALRSHLRRTVWACQPPELRSPIVAKDV
jgi:hypothetical protein